MEPKTQQERFSIVKRAKSFSHAGRGVWIFVKTTHNAWIHIAVFIIAIGLGIYFSIDVTEWMLLLLAAGIVLLTEAVNTAIEIDIDLTSAEYHPYARDTKDVAAGAVLIAACIAALVGFFIFGKHILLFVQSVL